MESPVSGEIVAYSYMVERGKPAAMLPIHERDVMNAVQFVEETFGLNTYVEDLAEGWKTLWIYKYEHVLSVIKYSPQAPKTILDYWILGKLFGYEESAIQEFILTNSIKVGTTTTRARGKGVSAVVKSYDLAATGALIDSNTGFFSSGWHKITSLIETL